METNGEALRDFIRSAMSQKHLCLEEGTISEWMYERVVDKKRASLGILNAQTVR